MTKEEMQAIREIMREELKPVNEKLDTMQSDIEVLKEEAAITRHSTNLLLKWAEKAERSVNVGLFEKAE